MRLSKLLYNKIVKEFAGNLEISVNNKPWIECFYPPKLKDYQQAKIFLSENDVIEIYLKNKNYALRLIDFSEKTIASFCQSKSI